MHSRTHPLQYPAAGARIVEQQARGNHGPTYVEAARGLAVRVLKEAQGDDTSRINWLWREALQRPPTDSEKTALLLLLAKHREEFHIDAPAAQAFGKLGAPAPADVDGAELAAWSSVTRVVMNLHEFITRS